MNNLKPGYVPAGWKRGCKVASFNSANAFAREVRPANTDVASEYYDQEGNANALAWLAWWLSPPTEGELLAEQVGTQIAAHAAATYGCHNRNAYPATYMPTVGRPVGALHLNKEIDKYAIPHRMAKDCQYTKTALGQRDPKCKGCKWRQEDNPTS